MNSYLFLFKGFVTPTPEIGAAWQAWFSDNADRMVDSGKPMSHGYEIAGETVEQIEPGRDSFTGYAILTAESEEDAIAIAKTNPMITSVVLYQLGRM
jgi:hypothetical protein